MKARVVLVVYVVFLAVVGFFPSPVDRPAKGTLDVIIEWCSHHYLGFITFWLIEFTANIAFFIPLGLLLTWVLGERAWWFAIPLCIAATMTIEFIQEVALPGRYASAGDILANTTGGVIGVIVARLITRGSARRRATTASA